MSDNLSYGNPTNDLVVYLKRENYLDSLLPELKSYAPPQNNSNEALNELQEIKVLMETLQDDVLTKRYMLYDTKFAEHIMNSMLKMGIERSDFLSLLNDVRDDIMPLLVKTKFHFQRIRPHQLAFYYNIPLYPYPSCTVDSPSYPSGHTVQARVYAIVLGNKYPKFYKPLMALAEDIAKSRQYLGLHYKSDITYGQYMADLIVSHPDFIKKYKL